MNCRYTRLPRIARQTTDTKITLRHEAPPKEYSHAVLVLHSSSSASSSISYCHTYPRTLVSLFQPCALSLSRMLGLSNMASRLHTSTVTFSLIVARLVLTELFHAMAVNRQWRDAGKTNYARRTQSVPACEDALLQAAAAASPGDTLLLQPGFHWLSAELLVEKPLRLQAHSPTVFTVLGTRCPSLLRTRCNVTLHGLTFCRMGEEEGYPNAVIVAETGFLFVDECRVTCGGTAPSIEHALLRAFEGAPAPGKVWPLDRLPPADPVINDADQTQPRAGPQSGIWVGSGARVKLHSSTISRCGGPGVKIYRGWLEAESIHAFMQFESF